MDKGYRDELKSNIRNYFIFKVFSNLSFFVPVVVLFYQENGLSLTQVLLLQSYFSILIILLEVPTGVIADKYSRRLSLILSTITITIGAFIYSASSTFTTFLVAETFWAFGCSFLSGADTALLYDTLKELKKEKEYKKIQGKGYYYTLIAGGLSAVVGGFIAKYSLRMTWLITAIMMLGLIFLAFRFREPQRFCKDQERPKYWDLIFQSLKFITKHRLVRWYLLFFSFIGFSTYLIFWASQPYMQKSGLDIAYFGLVFFFFNIVAAVSSRFSHRIESYLGVRKTLYILAAMITIPFFFLGGMTFRLSFLILAIYQIIRGVSSTISEDMILKYTYSDKRATVMSLKNLITRVIDASMMPFFGVITDMYSINTALMLSGAFFLVAMIIFIILYKAIPKKYFKVKRKR